MIYNKIAVFKYNNIDYILLLDRYKKYFFLKKEKNQYNYVTLDELSKFKSIFDVNINVLYIKNNSKKINIAPKIIIGGLAIILTNSFFNSTNIPTYNPESVPYSDSISISYETSDDLSIIDETYDQIQSDKEHFDVETISKRGNSYIVYDFSELDEVFGYPKESITYDIIRDVVSNNSNISDKYKELLFVLIDNLEKEYPNLDLRVWYENLKGLRIEECSKTRVMLKSVSPYAYACYRLDENVIYTVEDYEYIPGTWEYQIIMHELCHPISNGRFNIDGKDIIVKFNNSSGRGNIIDEALNSLFAVRCYDKDERDIAYQLQSNMMEIIVECLDDYTYQDYVEHNISYLENMMNNQNGNDLAVDVLTLIELQYRDYHDEDIFVEQDQFYLVYDYISYMFYSKYITQDMTYDEALSIRDLLIDRIMYDVPEDYNIDISHFYDYFEIYCSEIGLIKSKTI